MPLTSSSLSVIGLGSMGSALARAFADAGHRVTVWNRTWERAAPLASQARVAGSVLDACAASDLIVVSLLDYEVSDALLRVREVEAALRGKLVVQLSTGTPTSAREADVWAARHGIAYLDGAIMGYPRVIGTDQAVILYSGSKAVFDDNADVLRAIGGPMYCGDAVGAAATLDMALVEVLFATWASLLHGAALCEAEGYPLEAFFGALPGWLEAVGSIVGETQSMVTSGTFSGGNSSMAVNARAMSHVLEASRQSGIDTSFPAVLLRLCQATVDRGYADADFPAVYVTMAEGSEA